MFPSKLLPTTRVGAYCALVGLSTATIYGVLKAHTFWKEVQRTREHAHDTIRKQEEELGLLRRTIRQKEVEIEQRKAKEQAHAEDVDEHRRRMANLEKDLEGVKHQNQALHERNKSLALRNQELEGGLRRAKAEHQQTAELLAVRTTELKGAQAFLTKADQLSGADVIKLVEDLNGEIMQTAATLAEELPLELKKVDVDGKEQVSDDAVEAYARTEEVIGPRLTELLRVTEHNEDPIMIQIALQAGLSAYIHWIVSSWCFESPEDEHMLSEIYARVREAEEQAVSGRWRQLTRTHLQRMLNEELDLVFDVADALSNIFVAAGHKDNRLTIRDRIADGFSDQIGVVLKKAKRLNKHMGEGITSCDLEALYIAPDVTFNPVTMEDAIDSPTNHKPTNGLEPIICTTDLGLVRAEKVSGSRGEWNESILLRPKVILYSGIASVTNGSTE
ncbi:hypothetical protein CPC08DRAFT_634814 [Agrocybe pediades]|nr:hypothetical protein CPC08DRAFT_634814 [Agrocybe pediades]